MGFTLLSSIGAQESLATFLIAILLRELGPLMTAIIIVLRSGSAIALEIGYMNVLGEIEGLEMQGIPTLHFLFVPRLLGVTISVVCLVIVFDLIAIAGGFFAAWILANLNVWTLLHDLAASINRNDFIIVLAKALCFGVIIPVVCMYNGFLAKAAITSIPPRVSRALVDCLLYCVFFSVIITAAYSV
ncbi:MAG: ABC transporter permease [Thermodesulfobacteriota bacterium]|nr:ABC transporter permease [Thermodesulfobacteriota bacterium]